MIYPDDYLDQFAMSLRVDTNDTSKMSQLTMLMNSAMTIIENYCHRKFILQADQEKFVLDETKTIRLRRFPIASVESVVYANGMELNDYLLDAESGTIVFAERVFNSEVLVSYTGGFDPIPPDVLLALQSVVRKTFNEVTGDTGQAIRRMQSPDLGLVEYFDNSAFQTASGMAVRFGEMFNLLDPYRVYSV
jgi:hypothetical protein